MALIVLCVGAIVELTVAAGLDGRWVRTEAAVLRIDETAPTDGTWRVSAMNLPRWPVVHVTYSIDGSTYRGSLYAPAHESPLLVWVDRSEPRRIGFVSPVTTLVQTTTGVLTVVILALTTIAVVRPRSSVGEETESLRTMRRLRLSRKRTFTSSIAPSAHEKGRDVRRDDR